MSKDKQDKKSIFSPKAKQIIEITLTVIQVIIIVLCIVLSIIIWTGAAGDPSKRKLNWFAIRSDSMMKNDALDYEKLGFNSKYCFNPGDMVIVKKVSKENIKIGDVISYKSLKTDAEGKKSEQIVTHRVVDFDANGNIVACGDKDTDRESRDYISYNEVIGKMTGKLSGLGGIVLWLQGYKKVQTADGSIAYDYSGKSLAFLVIIIPLALLFAYNGYFVVKWAVREKIKKVEEQAKLDAAKEQATQTIDQDALRKEALRAMMLANGMTNEQIEAYFASQEINNNADSDSDTSKSELQSDTETEE